MAALTLKAKDYSDGVGGLDALTKKFSKLDKWPVENLTKKRFDLEPYWCQPDKKLYHSFDSALTSKTHFVVLILIMTH